MALKSFNKPIKYSVFLVVLVSLIGGVILIKNKDMQSNSKKHSIVQQNITSRVNLGGILQITFPCAAKPSIYPSNDSCITHDNSGVDNYSYDAYSDSSQNEYSTLCSNYSYQEGTTTVTTSYDVHSVNINGVSYIECGTYDAKDGLYSVNAAGINPNNTDEEAVMTVTAMGAQTANQNILWNKLNDFIGTIVFE